MVLLTLQKMLQQVYQPLNKKKKTIEKEKPVD
jgi:hypothetical protein